MKTDIGKLLANGLRDTAKHRNINKRVLIG